MKNFATGVQERTRHFFGRAALLRRPRVWAERQLCPTSQAKNFVLRPATGPGRFRKVLRDHTCSIYGWFWTGKYEMPA
jgi:hypothetical protein